MIFEWDEQKNAINLIKHGVAFEEARSVFADADAVVIYDEEHSGLEDRFVIIGLSVRYRELTVCHCYRVDETVIRIISARKATSRECALYGGRV